jgi:hypothetical protein
VITERTKVSPLLYPLSVYYFSLKGSEVLPVTEEINASQGLSTLVEVKLVKPLIRNSCELEEVGSPEGPVQIGIAMEISFNIETTGTSFAPWCELL